ncbi:hypothetical protein [Paludisphaera rhizosphaerae]|uniref:hypothetical protein n=1 Tax=Paludisphaera rhizosphaerae TaxID=2711216 RepID=UPI0013EB02A1|nr:hypothetical protein [Paludisphaera rhizosphaerae]
MSTYERLKDLHRKMFVRGQETAAKEVAAVEFAEQQGHAKVVLEAAAETITRANELAAENPQLRQLALDVEQAVREGAAEAITGGRQRAAGREEAPEASPFSDSSASSTRGSLKSPARKALPKNSEPPKKRGPGRPRKES